MANFIKCATVAFKGMCMGAADVIPGVSGGTIAFIMGIYAELLDSIKSVNGEALKLLLKGKIGAFWKHINGTFLQKGLQGMFRLYVSRMHLFFPSAGVSKPHH